MIPALNPVAFRIYSRLLLKRARIHSAHVREGIEIVIDVMGEKSEISGMDLALASGVTDAEEIKTANVCVEQSRKNELSDASLDKHTKDKRNKLRTREPRAFPNYFLSVPILSEQVKENFVNVQNKIVESNVNLKNLLISVPTIHLTLGVYFLKDEEQLDCAKRAMEESRTKIASVVDASPIDITITGVGSFGSDVLFAKVESSPGLTKISNIADILSESFKNNNLVATDVRPFSPHITILKLTKAKIALKKELKKHIHQLQEMFKEEEFGLEKATRIDLCSMGVEKGADGYYQILHQICLAGDTVTGVCKTET